MGRIRAAKKYGQQRKKGSEKMKRITKRIKTLAYGLIEEGIGHEWNYLKDKVLDDKDEEYTFEEYQNAIQWIWKKFD